MEREPYHSALRPPLAAVPASRWEDRGCVALVHNLWHKLPPEFDACDVFYSDPPWPRGYAEFCHRAGRPSPPAYRTFALHLNWIAYEISSGQFSSPLPPRPVVYVVGKSTLGYFLHRRAAFQVTLNGAPAVAVVYGRLDFGGLVGEEPDAEALLRFLAERYYCVGDFMAGYGRSGRVFARAGRRFVLSDFDASCVGHVAANAPGWFPP